jgi:glycosyltransferase involved in cell wall biosynthesis
VRVVSFSRNFGKEAAMYAGLAQASGRHCCFIDADMQQRPETAFAMLAELEKNPGFDCVAACQQNRRQGRVRAWLSRRFYGAFSSSSGMDVVDGASDFRVFTRAVADALLHMPEYFRFSKGLFAWIGFKTLPFAYSPDERLSGTTTWSLPKLVRYAAEGILSFSTSPLRIATFCGGLASFAALVYAIVVAVQRIAFGAEVPGYATIVILILLIGGVQLLVLGIMGEYLARAYIQGKHRPVYIVRETFSSTLPPAADAAGGAAEGTAGDGGL